ncbi:SusC/RagA family TonB-linked outer membrane protein [Parapedobacter lycopersici]|uniref:SusC/RagA family TonB-linked outer membrane protein n=1 Tax=Parapedobacter lycopersici TaxID=1864939 RepID=UPI00214DB6DA|nr:SusC/RagA family TonB-linked outer membrane protein [Parapedobacter lycopersici]
MMKPIVLLLALCLSLGAAAQQDIEGKILSSDSREPLRGVNIHAIGTDAVWQSDNNGAFSLRNIKPDSRLEFTYVGYRTLQLTAGALIDNPIVLLYVEESQLEEVQISTGYQRISKERTTGSYITVDNKLLNRTVNTDIISKLDGVVPGMLFNRNSNFKINIRGQSTLFSNMEPLIVLDNFPFERDILDINPNDIESVTVLKDAAAASIWGARAANGVIVLTSKKGRRNQPLQIDFRSNISIVEKPDIYYQPRMSSADFIDIEEMLFERGVYASAENSILKTPYTPVVQLLIAKRDGTMDAASVDAQLARLKQADIRDDLSRYVYRKEIKQQYALNLSGGSNINHFYVSLGYDQNRDELVRNGMKRFSLMAKNTLSLWKDRLEVYTGLELSNRIAANPNSGAVGLGMGGQSRLYPYASLMDESGNYARTVRNYALPFIDAAYEQGLLDWSYRPLEGVYLNDQSTKYAQYRVNTGVQAKILPGLDAGLLFQYINGASDYRRYRSVDTWYARDMINNLTTVNEDGSLTRPIPLGGILDNSYGRSASYNFRGQLNFARDVAEGQHLTAMLGYEVRDNRYTSNSSRMYGYNDNLAIGTNVDFVNRFPRYVYPASTAAIANNQEVSELIDRYRSVYGNVSYTLRGRYVLYGSARLDQSNLFGVRTNQKGVPLWSAGAAYTLSSEDFYGIDWLPYLKLRASYGYNGNANKSVTAYTTVRYDDGRFTRSRLPYARITNPPNPELRWEKVKVVNLGVDFALRKNMISGTVEYYRKKGLDLIGETPYAPSSGVQEFTRNYAHTKGQGIDVQLHSQNTRGRFVWTSDAVFSWVQDEVTHYLADLSSASSYVNAAHQNPVVGRPQFSIYSFDYVGLDGQTGNPVGYLNGEPSEDYLAILSGSSLDDLVFHGSARPTFFGGLRNTFQWNRFSLSANVVFRAGYYFRRSTVNFATVWRGTEQHGDYALRWQQPGDERHTVVPSMPETANPARDLFYANTGAFVERGDHIRLQDVNLTYSLPERLAQVAHVKALDVYLFMENLGVLWKATDLGLDPDHAYADYVPPRSIALGINVKF